MSHRLHEARRAAEGRAVEFERITFGVGHAAEEHVHRHQSAERLQADAVVADREVASLNQRVAEIAGEIGVFEVGRARRARAVQRDAGIVAAGGEAAEHPANRQEERGEPLDVALLEDAGQQSGDDEPVFQGIAQPLRNARAVAEHPPLAVAVAGDHRRVEMQPAAPGNRETVTAPQKTGMRVDQFGGHKALAEHVLRAVEIGQERVENPGPLVDSHLEPGPRPRAEYFWSSSPAITSGIGSSTHGRCSPELSLWRL